MRAWSAAVIGAAGAVAAPVVVMAVSMIAPVVVSRGAVTLAIITYKRELRCR